MPGTRTFCQAQDDARTADNFGGLGALLGGIVERLAEGLANR
jgi:hypothetical protein